MDWVNERFKFFKVDLLVDGSFDDVINGVDGVFYIVCFVFLFCEGC